ncbi:hypothetical protein ACFPH6_33770 [Streptomyces xiangluensis]|uniref:Uncharacterized protein n=1 Tax=Streptomyces xiangluensis TaxID=2665720 RepID=A0ABV8YW08_9ACTN
MTLNNTPAVAAEPRRDWREKGGQELAGLLAGATPFYGSLIPYVTPAA